MVSATLQRDRIYIALVFSRKGAEGMTELEDSGGGIPAAGQRLEAVATQDGIRNRVQSNAVGCSRLNSILTFRHSLSARRDAVALPFPKRTPFRHSVFPSFRFSVIPSFPFG